VPPLREGDTGGGGASLIFFGREGEKRRERLARMRVLLTVETRSSKRRAASRLGPSCRCLFLDLPMDQTRYLRRLAEGESPERVVGEMESRGKVRIPEDLQELRALDPLLRVLSGREVRIFGYRDPSSYRISRETAEDLLRLTVRAKLGRIRAGEWKEVLRREVESRLEAAGLEADFIASRAEEENVCLDAPAELVSLLSERGFEMEVETVDPPCRPLDLLLSRVREERLGGREVGEEEVGGLVREHLRFVDLVVERGYERAYELWKLRAG